MSAHTPGPWTLDVVRTQVGRCFRIGPFPGQRPHENTHACVYDDSYAAGTEHGNEELAANARVIAAAPDLLAALEETREVAGACFRVVVLMGLIPQFFKQLPKGLAERTEGFGVRADRAIAKARGEA